MEYGKFMNEAVRTFNDRNPKYGDMRIGMENVATLATIMTGIHLTAHDVALVLHAVKLSRLNNDRANPDHYVDGINYFAFAGELVCNTDDDPYGVKAQVTAALADNEAIEVAEQPIQTHND